MTCAPESSPSSSVPCCASWPLPLSSSRWYACATLSPLLRDEVVSLRTESSQVIGELRESTASAAEAVATARADLDRFDHLLGSAEAISSVVGRGNRVGRAALSAPMIKAAGIATGTSRAVRRLRSES